MNTKHQNRLSASQSRKWLQRNGPTMRMANGRQKRISPNFDKLYYEAMSKILTYKARSKRNELW